MPRLKQIPNGIISYKGNKMTLMNLCKKYNMPYPTVYRRFCLCGWTIKNALETPVSKYHREKALNNSILIKYKGESRPLVEWCKLLKVNYNTIVSRLRADWSIEEALGNPIRKKVSYN